MASRGARRVPGSVSPPACRPWLGELDSGDVGSQIRRLRHRMFVAARAPWPNRLWIDTMIAIQAVDFIATAVYLANGVLPAGHVGSAVVPPLLWIAVLGGARRRAQPRASAEPSRTTEHVVC